MKKDDMLYLIHMAECIQRVEEYAVTGHAEFLISTLLQDAVVRNQQIMAESSQRISETARQRHPEVEWKIAGLRNILVHDYLGIDLTTVWNIVVNELPKLKQAVQTTTAEA